MNDIDFTNFFNKVEEIKKKNQQSLEDGNEFNIFWLLDIERNELYHSYIIAELLCPNTFHGQETLFLKEFAEIIKPIYQERNSDFNFIFDKEVEFESEYPIGNINADYTEGGRIDILLKDKNGNKIIIENKIYAIDQKNQLLRYQNYAKRDGKKFVILYLTLDGKEIYQNDEKVEYYPISYKKEICDWLRICKQKVIGKNKVFYLVDSYLQMLDYLTQNERNGIYKELIELLKNEKQETKIIIEKKLELENPNSIFWNNETSGINYSKNYDFIKPSIEHLIKEIRYKFAIDLQNIVNNEFRDDLSIIVEQCEYFNNNKDCYGLGFKVLKNNIPVNYNGDGFGGFGEGIFIENINAHLGENIDKTNAILFEKLTSNKWDELLETSSKLIIQKLDKIKNNI